MKATRKSTRTLRFISLLTGILMLLATVSCQSADNIEESQSTPETPESTAETSEAVIFDLTDAQPVESLSSFFFDNTNKSGSLIQFPDETFSPEGTVLGNQVDPACVPQTDRNSVVNIRYAIRLLPDTSYPQFYYFLTNSGEERLVVFLNASIPAILVFRPELGGAKGFLQAIRTKEPFPATLLCLSNIAPDDYVWIHQSLAINSHNQLPIDLTTTVTMPIGDRELLAGQVLEDETSVWLVKDNSMPAEHLNKTISRFDLQPFVS